MESLNPTFLNIGVYCWSDSVDCIHWINNNLKMWKQFIQYRVIKIRDSLPGIKGLHCPGSLTPPPPPDIPSRGIDICNDKFLELWLNSPEFFVLSKDMWPPEDNVIRSSRPEEACNFIRKETLAQVFSCGFCQISKITFLHRTPMVAASALCVIV